MLVLPYGDRVLVKKDPIAEKTDGGIIIDREKDDRILHTGVIQAIGKKTLELVVGYRVVFNKYSGVQYKDDLVILKQDEILAILEK